MLEGQLCIVAWVEHSDEKHTLASRSGSLGLSGKKIGSSILESLSHVKCH